LTSFIEKTHGWLSDLDCSPGVNTTTRWPENCSLGI